MATRSFASKNDPLHNFYSLLEAKGHKKKGSLETDLSPKDFDRIIGNDPELQAALGEVDRSVQKQLAALRVRPRAPSREPVKVAITGAAGGIGYATIFRIASGAMLGPDQPVHLHLLELPQARPALDGIIMELHDCAFPLLAGVTATDDVLKGFEGVDYALLIGAKPRSKGMERADLLRDNAAIFKTQGEALNKVANRDTLRVLVVGNPANTNAWIAAQCAPDLSPTQFTAMTRLDHNRGLGQLALKTGAPVNRIEQFAIWGNHSNTMVPDVNNALINGKWAKDVINDQKWIDTTFTTTVQNRGAQVIAARGASSCASAASAAIDHMHDWALGTYGSVTSMAVWSDGSYGTEPGIYYSFPVVCANGGYPIVQNVPIDPATAKKMEASNAELVAERDAVMGALKLEKRNIKETFAKWKAEFDKNKKLPFFYPPTL